MLNTRLDRRPITKSARLAAVVAFVGITLPIAGFGLAAQTLAAVEAVRQWVYDWTLLNCVPIEVPMTVTVHFRSQP